SGQGAARIPLGASWQVGIGQVAALAFEASPAEVAALAGLVARQPRDPRFKVSWSPGEHLSVSVDALSDQRPMNGLQMQVALIDESDPTGKVSSFPLPQNGPGRYETSLPAPRSAMMAMVRLGDRTIDRFAVAGRYAPEFNRIGNDRSAMGELAR